jgi:hypothetical protein
MSEISDILFKHAQHGRAMNAARATIGKLETNGSTTIDVPGRASDVYVTRRGNGDATVSVVEFRGGARIAGYPVIVEVDPLTGREYTSVPNSAEAAQFLGERPMSYAPTHASSHSLEGGDPITITQRQMIAGLVYVDSGLTLKVAKTPFRWRGQKRTLPESTVDLTPELPATTGTKAWIVICLDGGISPAELVAVGGAEQPGSLPSLTPESIEEIDTGAYLPICAVQVSAGQTASPRESDFYDLRTFLEAPLELTYSTANVSNPPTDAQLDTEFGAPADVGTNFAALLNDAGGGTNEYLVLSDGTNWLYAALTKAV